MAEDDEEVHGSYFCQKVFGAVEPEVLSVPLFCGELLGEDAWCVVDAKFVGACACVVFYLI